MPGYVPSYSNPSPTYQPAMRVIAAMTQTNPIQITTTIDHDYISGIVVRLDIPPHFGMQQANQQTGAITVTGNTTFTMDINALSFDAFVLPTSFPPAYQDAQVVPIGEVNETLRAATQNVLPFQTLP